ncbi:MAG: right-handed parallel beta-helix repeat-containing protein [bacterium]
MILFERKRFRRRKEAILFFLLLCALPACSSDSPAPNPPPACSKDYWVSTGGNDSASGESHAPFLTLERAHQAVRSDPDLRACAVNVNIEGGTYRLSQPLTFDAADSGSQTAPVTYQAVPGQTVVISGGQPITGWHLHDPALNIWEASVEIQGSVMPRQLYINGIRATRARTPDYPNYYFPGANGYTYSYLIGPDPIPPVWNNPTAVEAVTVTQWKMMRCPIAAVNGGTEVVMQNPCWKNANVFPSPWNFHLLSWLENAYEFVDDPGEWYLNPATHLLYYIPRSGEDLTTADVELPVQEALVQGGGTETNAISNLRFVGLTFSYATWLQPNTSEGYALDQGGFFLTGDGHDSNLVGHDSNAVGTPGNVAFRFAQNISFEGNTFSHLGAVGLSFDTGSQNNQIEGNTFTDISSTAIKVGGISPLDAHPATDSQITRDNRIANNWIEYPGQDYYDAPGIFLGFTTRSTVEHNDIRHTPWAGIAIGWGWGMLDPTSNGFCGLPHGTPFLWGDYSQSTPAQGNQILHNHITYFLEKLWDGGAIYTQGFQGTSFDDGQLIAWNVAENKRPKAGGNTFYTDGGSRYSTLLENVSLNNPVGFFDFGPCLLASSFPLELCALTDAVPYGADMGGCIPYGDLRLENNYFLDQLTFYSICSNPYFPDNPVGMEFLNNHRVTDKSQVPQWILDSAGRH